MIGDVFEDGEVGALGAARSVYLALSEIASDRQSDTFTVATSYIAQRAGVTSKTVRRVIVTLKKLGFVKTRARSANGLKLATEYCLIRTNEGPIGSIYPTLSKRAKVALPIREEYPEQSPEGSSRTKEIELCRNKGAKTSERFNQKTGEYEW